MSQVASDRPNCILLSAPKTSTNVQDCRISTSPLARDIFKALNVSAEEIYFLRPDSIAFFKTLLSLHHIDVVHGDGEIIINQIIIWEIYFQHDDFRFRRSRWRMKSKGLKVSNRLRWREENSVKASDDHIEIKIFDKKMWSERVDR